MRPVPPRRAAMLLAAMLPLVTAGCATLFGPHNDLIASGFVSRRADTPARQAMLVRLPAHTFVRRPHGRTLSYAYADPAACDCLYVGSARAFRRYARRVEQRGAAPAALGATDYFDDHWDWTAWGALEPGFRYGPGIGW